MAKAAAAKERIWLKSYSEVTPAEIGELAYPSVGKLIEDSCKKFSGKPAFECMGKTMTYADLEQHSRALGAWLQGLGLEKGDRVAVMMPNILQTPIAITAILRAGYTVVNVNPLYTPRELEHQLTDSGAKAIIILENFAVTLEQVIARTHVKHVSVATMGDMLGIKGHIVNFVVRKIKSWCPAGRCRQHCLQGCP